MPTQTKSKYVKHTLAFGTKDFVHTNLKKNTCKTVYKIQCLKNGL